jgi:hypothetical protein
MSMIVKDSHQNTCVFVGDHKSLVLGPDLTNCNDNNFHPQGEQLLFHKWKPSAVSPLQAESTNTN